MIYVGVQKIIYWIKLQKKINFEVFVVFIFSPHLLIKFTLWLLLWFTKLESNFVQDLNFCIWKLKQKKTENKIYRQQNSNFDKMAKNQTIEENLSVPNSYNLQISKKEMTTTHHFKTYIVSSFISQIPIKFTWYHFLSEPTISISIVLVVNYNNL